MKVVLKDSKGDNTAEEFKGQKTKTVSRSRGRAEQMQKVPCSGRGDACRRRVYCNCCSCSSFLSSVFSFLYREANGASTACLHVARLSVLSFFPLISMHSVSCLPSSWSRIANPPARPLPGSFLSSNIFCVHFVPSLSFLMCNPAPLLPSTALTFFSSLLSLFAASHSVFLSLPSFPLLIPVLHPFPVSFLSLYDSLTFCPPFLCLRVAPPPIFSPPAILSVRMSFLLLCFPYRPPSPSSTFLLSPPCPPLVLFLSLFLSRYLSAPPFRTTFVLPPSFWLLPPSPSRPPIPPPLLLSFPSRTSRSSKTSLFCLRLPAVAKSKSGYLQFNGSHTLRRRLVYGSRA